MSTSHDKELLAIAEIGEVRSKVKTIAFLCAWMGWAIMLFGLRAVGVYIGVLYVVILAALMAGGTAAAILRSWSPSIIENVTKKHGIDSQTLNAEKYLIK